MNDTKSLNGKACQIASNAEAMDSLTGNDRNFLTNLLEVQDRTGKKALTPRQKNMIKNILKKVDHFLEERQ